MKKISYFKSLLALMLVCGSLVGCTPNSQSTNPEGNQQTSGQTTDSKQLNKITAAYNNFKSAETKFIENLKAAVSDEQVRQSIKSDAVNQNLGILKTTIATFQTQELPRLDTNKQASLTTILNNINTSLDEISKKIIEPLKNGLTKGSVEKVQRNLDFFKQNGIPEDQYGIYGETSYEEIEKFLQAKNTELDTKIKELNQKLGTSIDPAEFQKIPNRVNSLEQENKNLKNTSKITFVIALFAIFISIFKSPRRKKSTTNIPAREKTNNSFASIKNKLFGGFFGRKIARNGEESQGGTIPDQNQIYYNLYEPLNKRVSLLESTQRGSKKESKIEQRLSNLESSVNQLENLMEQLIETANQRNLSSGTREQTHTKTPTWQDTKQPVNPTPVVSTPQVSNLSTPQWINTYNNNPDSLSRNVTEVSPTEESLTKRRLGSSQTVILATKRRGNYWIFTEGSYDYLVPSQSLRINQHNYKTVEALFECRNYQPNYSDDFKLVKPAVVYPLSGGQTWQLQESGILEF